MPRGPAEPRRSVGIESQELENDVMSDQNTLHSPLSLS